MKLIPLMPFAHGFHAMVDDADFELLSSMRWKVKWQNRRDGTRLRYVVRTTDRVRMHRFIMDAMPGQLIDHKDLNGLNNQRENLRLCSVQQNNQNRNSWMHHGLKGISWRSNRGHWIASIKVNRKMKYLGSFSAKEDAAQCYDRAAIKYFGEFARPNFPMSAA